MIAFVKDTLIYLVIIVAIIYLPRRSAAGTRSSARPRTRWRPPTRRRASRPARSSRATAQYWAYATLALGLGAGAVHVPALDHREPVVQEPQHDPPQRGRSCRRTPSCSGCSRCSAGWRSRPAPSRSASTASRTPSWSSRSCSRTSSRLVRRRRLRGHRDRCAGAGGDHVDRGGEHLHPQHLQGVAQAGRHARPGGQGLQAGLAGW